MVCASFLGSISVGATNPADTWEGKKALTCAKEKEENPLIKDGKDTGTRAMNYLISKKDMNLILRTGLIGPVLQEGTNPKKALLATQRVFSIYR